MRYVFTDTFQCGLTDSKFFSGIMSQFTCVRI